LYAIWSLNGPLGSDRDSLAADRRGDTVLEGATVELVTDECDFEVWRDLVVRSDPHVVPVVE
jgi:hypothetical protein